MLIYSTQTSLQLLTTARHWTMDGTFKIVPQLFFQLYTVHALIQGQTIPCAYGLLPNKQEVTYTNFFQILKEAQPNLNPESITIDFELAAKNAVTSVFPDTHLHGCNFHLSQCVYRRVQAAKLQRQYTEDGDFSLSVRMVPGSLPSQHMEVPGCSEEGGRDEPGHADPTEFWPGSPSYQKEVP